MTTVCCKACKGTGRRPLRGVIDETLAAIPSDWTSLSTITASLAPRAPKQTALANRLARLVLLDLVEVREDPNDGRRQQWRRR